MTRGKASTFLVLLAWMLTGVCHAATGPIVIDGKYPESFRQTSGERFFPMGDTAYFLIAQPTNVIAQYVDSRRAHRFNFIRVMAAAEGFWPWGGSVAKPDYGTVQEEAMRKWDWVFDYCASREMNLELILWGYGVAGGEGLWGHESDVRLWVATLVNRFKGRTNLLMFTIANEFERYPNGKYDYEPADVTWVWNVAAQIRSLDPIHAIGCHPSVWITDRQPKRFPAYQAFTQRFPPIVWPLWDGSAVNLNVTQNNEGVQPRTWGNLNGGGRGLTYYPTNSHGVEYPARWTDEGWDFEAAELEDCIAEDRARGKPVLNTEFGYQFEPGYEKAAGYLTRQVHQPSSVRRRAWKIATAGGYFAAGFLGTAVRNFDHADVTNFRPGQLEILYDFFTQRTAYWKMSPRLDLVAAHNVLLASPGQEYVAYFPRGGVNTVKLESGHYQLEWLHPESGKFYAHSEFRAPGGAGEFTPPERPGDDWVLHLRVIQ